MRALSACCHVCRAASCRANLTVLLNFTVLIKVFIRHAPDSRLAVPALAMLTLLWCECLEIKLMRAHCGS